MAEVRPEPLDLHLEAIGQDRIGGDEGAGEEAEDEDHDERNQCLTVGKPPDPALSPRGRRGYADAGSRSESG